MPGRYTINYCCINIKGGIRKINQDNFYVRGNFRRANDPDTDLIYSGKIYPQDNDLLAVYDGMGGESCGEIASLIAASGTAAFNKKNNNREAALKELCIHLNNSVFAYTLKNRISCMGTTAAIIEFDKSRIYTCNLGDSRIYLIRDGAIVQLSKDHVLSGYASGKPPLTQFLGIPESEISLEPYFTCLNYRSGDKYLLCSDGITDMLSDEKILKITEESDNADVGAKNLVSNALKNGGIDNITAILCEIEDNMGLHSILNKFNTKSGKKTRR